ncbi:MAG: MFS transporter [Bacillota bacterium]
MESSYHLKSNRKSYFPLLSWLTLFFGFVLVVLHRFATASMQDIFTENFAMGSSSFALLSSSYFYLYPLMQVPAGFALDLWGPRKIVSFSFLIMSAGTLIFATAMSFSQLLLGRIIISFGAAFIWGALLKVQGLYFSGRVFALLAGMGGVGASLGIILAGSPLMTGITNLGWREINFLLALITVLLMLSNLAFTGNSHPSSEKPKTASFKKELKNTLKGALLVLKDRSSWLLFICHFGIYGSYAAFLGIWSYPLLVGKAGYEISQASFLITFMGFSYMLGGPALGHLSDRLGEKRRPVLMLSSGVLTFFTATLLLLPYFANSTDALIYPSLFALGFFTPSLILTMVLSRELQDYNYSGVAVGIANSGGFVGTALAQLTVGFILERGWEDDFAGGIMNYPWPVFQQVIIFSILLLLLAFFSAYLVKENK